MNYWFLYNLSDGSIFGAPYLGIAEEWTNIPSGCGVLGPLPKDSAPEEVVDAFNNPQYYMVQNDELVQKPDYAASLLEDVKARKIAELDQMCNQTILAGFTSSALGAPHQYDFDEEAQRNFAGTLALLNVDSTITSITWKTVDAGPLTHTRDQFIQLCRDAFNFKDSQIQKYWSKKNQVLQSTTVDQVNAITWDDPTPVASTPVASTPVASTPI
ncbi:hypothetical protein DNHGIG_25980 [Collibacillus ludicampi]|uniref:DUF4376 domain-containing protein n=1 Tax=Collibacillus ludicampi TaxID=2771369 RepID=A0AAV4LHQ4_9BACL|nr:hypothetical protein [Collibacillus ludicampi]GIM47049.1 hypothetical protein DNHGIG_25980 [Collibacillus ludicampi]